MPARPIIDILVALSDLGAAQKLREIGYEASDEGCFIKKEIGIAYTVRVVMRKDYQAAAHYLAIPQYLCENKQAAAEFAQKKREIATLSEQEYAIASKQLLDEIMPAALEYKRAADKRSTYMAIGMCLGAGIGSCLGLAFDNVAIGTCMGISVGMCLGLALGSVGASDQNGKNQK